MVTSWRETPIHIYAIVDRVAYRAGRIPDIDDSRLSAPSSRRAGRRKGKKIMEIVPSISFGGPDVYDKEPRLPEGSRAFWDAYLAGPEAERQYWAMRREKESK